MGYDLSNEEGGYYRFNIHSWGPILSLAEDNGWEPAGTTIYITKKKIIVADDNWDGSYFGNDGQTVSREDASNLANALERALLNLSDETKTPLMITFADKIPENYTPNKNHLPSLTEDEDVIVMKYGHYKNEWYPGKTGTTPHILFVPGKAMIKYRNEEDAYPELYWSGTSNKKYVEGFIDFCRQGAFNIY